MSEPSADVPCLCRFANDTGNMLRSRLRGGFSNAVTSWDLKEALIAGPWGRQVCLSSLISELGALGCPRRESGFLALLLPSSPSYPPTFQPLHTCQNDYGNETPSWAERADLKEILFLPCSRPFFSFFFCLCFLFYSFCSRLLGSREIKGGGGNPPGKWVLNTYCCQQGFTLIHSGLIARFPCW